jgi:hypothetical protein
MNTFVRNWFLAQYYYVVLLLTKDKTKEAYQVKRKPRFAAVSGLQ